MTRVTTRLIAAFVVLMLAALPLAGVVCAHECSTPAAVAEAAAEHCHKGGASDTATMSASVPAGCTSPFAVTRIATRDRGTTPVSPAPVSAPPLYVADIAPALAYQRVLHTFGPPARAAGLSAGAHMPLRI